MHPPIEQSPFAFVAIQAALRAGNILKRGFGTNFSISTKDSAQNLVTEFDQAAEKAIIDYIYEEFPDHSFLAEEGGYFNENKSNIQWIIDPLDGTMNFAHHIPLFAVSIAAKVAEDIEVGVIYQPISNELFIAQKGRGAYLNGQRLMVSKVIDIRYAIGATGFPYDDAETRQRCIEQFTQILNKGNPLRIIGSAALNLAYVAAGRFDAFWAANLKPWDVAAGKLLVEEAGGRITHFGNIPYNPFLNPSTVATNGLLHDEISHFLQ